LASAQPTKTESAEISTKMPQQAARFIFNWRVTKFRGNNCTIGHDALDWLLYPLIACQQLGELVCSSWRTRISNCTDKIVPIRPKITDSMALVAPTPQDKAESKTDNRMPASGTILGTLCKGTRRTVAPREKNAPAKCFQYLARSHEL